ncbi:LysR substrate-binding domain-containing protein [Sphingomonas sp. IC4-52]|uniref:LysR substrate-binding domain-containing protein n=1 Tax=Sphingomonas sp. IC4-52 TaxID=2887202 RepID=UPI001D110595|nr:LysR substrate-binding domain-containing protein [Sphingomonas sp. IC4-52]MCC2980549.1 hypothetical protein [Sphingomonas sp. IC4-52]
MHPLLPLTAGDRSSHTLAIGCFASLCRDRLAEPLVAFTTTHPDVAVGVHDMSLGELLPAVEARRIAIAICPCEPVEELAHTNLWIDHAVVAMSRDHPLAVAPSIHAALLREEVLLISRDRNRAQLNRFLIERLFASTPPARIIADPRNDRLLERVSAGEGIALLCESQVDASLAPLVVRPLADARASFRLRAHWHASDGAPPLDTLLDLLTASREPRN